MIDEIIDGVQTLLYSADLEYDAARIMPWVLVICLGIGASIGIVLYPGHPYLLLICAIVFLILLAGVYAALVVMANRRISVIEEILPDFLSIMSSNIRSGLTYDRALLMSARKEFGPLSKEIDRAAKETISGKPLPEAMMNMVRRVKSETFAKTIRLIVEGINSGGNLADLLEKTSLDIRRYSAMRKEVAATVLMYQLFILAAAAIGAPLLYAVSSILVGITDALRTRMASAQDSTITPFFGGSSSVSPEFIFFFSIAALAVTAFFSSLASGVISKGKESEGFAYVPVMLVVSILLFVVTKAAIQAVFSSIFMI